MGLIVLAGVVALVLLQLREDDKPNGTTLVLVAIGLGLAFVLVMPRTAGEFFERMTKVTIAGVEISLAEKERAERVSRRLPRQEDGVPVRARPRTGDSAVDIVRVQDIVRMRLRFVRSALLGLGAEFDYLDILAHLHEEELLDTDEARLVLDLLQEEVAVWPERTRESFLDAAWPFAVRLGSLIFDRYVRKRLKEQNWRIAEFQQKRDHRPDFLAFRDGRWIAAAARVARPWGTLEASRRRLAEDVPPEATRRVVIVPEETELQDDGLYPEVEVIPLPEML